MPTDTNLKFTMETLIDLPSEQMEHQLMDMSFNECEEILKKILNNEEQDQISKLLKSLQCETQESTNRKVQVFEYTLDFLRRSNNVEEKFKRQLVTALVVNGSNLPTSAVITMLDYFMKLLENGEPFEGRWTEVFGCFVHSVAKKEKEDITLNGDLLNISSIVTKLCAVHWNTPTAITLLSILKEVSLGKEELLEVMDKCRSVLKKADYQSIPPVVYHLVVMGLDKCPTKLLDFVIDYFNGQENMFLQKNEASDSSDDITLMEDSTQHFGTGTKESFLEAKGTVILHLTNLCQYNFNLGKNYLKTLQSSSWIPQKVLTPFNLSLGLSLASINRYEEPILKSLKSCILKHFRLMNRASHSLWLQDTCAQKHYPILQMLKETAKNIPGWEQISKGMVDLCFSLVDGTSGVNVDSCVMQKCVDIGCEVLPIIIKKEPHMSPMILRQVSLSIFTSSSPQNYINIFGKLVKTCPCALLENQNIIQDIFEHMNLLPLNMATYVVQCTLPLLKMSMSIKDTLVMILKKMLFSREVPSRQVAVQGLILILCHFRVIGALPSSQASMSFLSTLSQFSVDVHSNINNDTNEALCLELLGVLRRCLSQQAEVKSILYSGLHDVMRANPNLSSNILMMLQQQAKGFLDPREDCLNPILLDKTVAEGDNVSLMEPFGELVSAIATCKAWVRSTMHEELSEEMEPIFQQLDPIYEKLVEKLARADVDDLDLSSCSFTSTTAIGRRNLLKVQVLLGALDALIIERLSSGALETEQKAQVLVDLYESQKRIVEFSQKSQQKGSKKDSKAKGKSKALPVRSLLPLETVAHLLNVALSKNSQNPAQKVLQEAIDFQMNLLSVVESFVKEVPSKTVAVRDREFPHFKAIARDLLTFIRVSFENLEREDNSPNLIRKALSGFHSLLVAFLQQYPLKMGSVLKELMNKTSSANLNSLYFSLFKKFQEMCRIIFGKDIEAHAKSISIVLSIIEVILKEMNSSEELSSIQDWLAQICRDEVISSGVLCEQFVRLLLNVSSKMKVNNSVVRHFAKDVHKHLGDIDADIEVDEETSCRIITEESAPCVVSPILTYLEESISLINVALQNGRACCMSQMLTDKETFDKNVSIRFAVIIQSIHELITSAIPQNNFRDCLFRISTKVYNELSLFIRYHLDMYKTKSCTELSEKFEKVIHNSANLLKEDIFKMINYVQNVQGQAKNTNARVLAQRAFKESKLIPSLIFSMEQYENVLALLSKKSKVNLMSSIKLSTSRDFRISVPAIERAFGDENQSVDHKNSISDNESDEETPSKKRKTDSS